MKTSTFFQTQPWANIANYCPYLGGEAVFQARALLNDDVVYNDSLLCASASPIKKQADNKPAAAFKLYPNPSNGYTLVELKEAAEMDGEVLLFNSLGRQLYVQKFAKGDTTLLLDFDELSAGTYFLQVKTGNITSTKVFSNLK